MQYKKLFSALFALWLLLTGYMASAQLMVTGGAYVYMTNGSSVIVTGDLTNSGSITGPGTLYLNGSSQQAVKGIGDISNLTLNNSSGAVISSGASHMQNIYGTLIISNGNLATNDNLTIKSNANGTAQVGNSAGTITGYVTVERYIADPGHRSWHLLSTNTYNSGQTIKQAWQENGGPIVSNIGTLISSNLYNGSNGFDIASVSSSILTHNQGGTNGPSWNYNLPNTNSTVWASNPGYMLFVRGDRNYTPGNSPSTSPTLLRSKGSLYQGTQAAVLVSATGPGRTLVGNPFASTIDLEGIFASPSSLDQNFYIWDPTMTGNYGVGGFRVVQRNGANSYTATPSTGANDNNLHYIPSGMAFFLKASGSDAHVIFSENSKSSGTTVINPIVNIIGDQQLVANLMLVNAGNTESLADGMRVRFDNSYSASLNDDIEKISNFGENIASYRLGKKLIVEQRPMILATDTIFIRLSNTVARNYRFQVNTLNFVQLNLNAWIQDSWLNTNTPLNLNGSMNAYDFSVTADPASANPDRFRIVFVQNGPLPVTFTRITAQQQNDDVLVEWNVSNQNNINKYEVERSVDGTNFMYKSTQSATGMNGSDAHYSWLDVQPVAGDNFYRIRSIGTGGEIKYSPVVKVNIGKGNPGIIIYPNPVTGPYIKLQFSDMEKGEYPVRLINAAGQVMLTQTVSHKGGNATQAILLGKRLAAGSYNMEINTPDDRKITKTLLIVE